MKLALTRLGLLALVVVAAGLAACGGGGGGGTAAAPPADGGGVAPGNVAAAISAAAQDPANDTSTNPSSGLTVLQNAGLPVVQVASAPRVNFTVFSDGKVLNNLQPGNNARFIIAKLVRTPGQPDQWQSYTWRTRTGAAVVDAVQHYLVQDGGPGSGTGNYSTAANLIFNAATGYYTFTYPIDITNPANLPPGVTWDPTATHRVAIQLRWTNAAGEDVRTQIYYDFTFDANGNSVPVTAAQTRKVVDISTCNECHNPLRIHGGRTDTQYCVLCHNPNTIDEETGKTVDFKYMVHKIHAGRFIFEEHGEDYIVQSESFKEVGFPANVRNCTKCHDASKSAQGNNWKEVPNKNACLTCHASDNTSDWYAVHITTLGLGTSAADVADSTCTSCHSSLSPTPIVTPEQAHWLQELKNTALYQNKIESVNLTTAPTDTTPGEVTVVVAVVNPTTGAAYDLREGCTGATTDQAGTAIVGCNTNYRWYTTTPPGAPQDKFGTFSVYLATETLPQTVNDTTNTTSYSAYRGVVDANNRYTVKLTVPAGARGNARVVMVGSVAEPRVDPKTRVVVGAVPPVVHEDLAYVPVKNAISELNIRTGGNSARRMIVSNDKCNNCHVYLGIPMNPEFGAHAFHSGLRNNSENCEICHNAYRAGTYTAMADGTDPAYNESWQARRFVHALHGRDKRMYAFSHGNDQVGPFDIEGNPLPGATTTFGNFLGGTTEVLNLTAEVQFPGRLADCNTCHVNESWKQNLAVLGSQLVSTSLNLNADGTAYINPGINRLAAIAAACPGGWTGSVATLDLACPGGIDNLQLPVISPKASVCTSCHDELGVQNHLKFSGGGAFGTDAFGTLVTQNVILSGGVSEICNGCHQPGSGVSAADISIVHFR